AGIGKTSLAIEIAQTAKYEAIFWHRFYDQNLNTFIRRLAGFLAHFGRSDLWEMIESARLAGVRPPDVITCFDTLATQLSGIDLLLCFDDLQFADASQELVDFLRRLLEPNEEDANPAVLITSRRFPTFLPADLRSELSGLSLSDTAKLLVKRGLSLSASLTAELHNVTEGHGAFLTLAMVVLQSSQYPADLIKQLATIDDIERFLLEEVNDRLSGQEQRVMEGIAILCGYPGTRDVLEVMLNQRDVRRTLRALTDQHLLASDEGGNGREFSQHQIIQTFYYDQPTRQKKRELHHNAAEFYTLEEVNHFKATLHHAKAGADDLAVRLVAKYLWDMINQGMAATLQPILESIKEEGLAQDDRFELWLALGQLAALLGDYKSGRKQFELAAQALQKLPENERTRQLKGRVCLYMAELLERQEPPEALDWGQRGLAILAGEHSALTAELKVQIGTLMMNMGNMGGALEQFLDCQEDVPAKNLALQVKIDKSLGGVYWHLNNLPLAIEHSEKALEISKNQRDHLQTAQIYTNLGPIKYALENWGGAISDLEKALVIASRLGSYQFTIALHINLGRCYYHAGIAQKTLDHLEIGLKMAEKIGSHFTIHAKINLAKHYLTIDSPTSALDLMETAEKEAMSSNDQLSLAVIHGIQADAFCANADLENARLKIDVALKEAGLIGNPHEQGIGWRIKGKLSFADGDVQAAEIAFANSINLLTPIDRFESALTHLEWGKRLIEKAAHQKGISLINQAHQVFTQLGAARELEVTTELLFSNEYSS
ncbi:MAG: tetratricopeptide (TPR) repeat protein, partial [Candidatus Promineifilaceae bacterium]